ncbi:MAG TPA: cohesin domain-containing protein [Thermoanaerobaculia bacterium]|nr:cohesin domain-containing protein [Thermoanaerobaculia bacterium]
MRRSRSLTALCGVLLLSLACGGGGGGGGGPVDPGPPAAALTFTPGGTAGGNVVLLTRTGSTSGRDLELAVEAREVTSLYGVAFDLGYPASVLSFEGATQGPFLSSGGFQVSLQVAEETGNLIVGVTRLGAVGGASGSGTLVTLRFTAVGSGGGDLTFSRTRAIDPQGQAIDDVAFVGGSVQSTF